MIEGKQCKEYSKVKIQNCRFLFLIFLLQPLILRSQSTYYHPFPEDSATWVSDIYYNTCFGYCGSLYYEMKGDTLISGQSYNKIYKREGQFHYISVPPSSIVGGTFSTCSYVGAVRQNISNKTVYFRDSSMTTDTLFYDFNLNIGDSINNWYNTSGIQWPLIVSSVDSIAINGNYFKRFNFDGYISGLNRSLIEGYGWSGELFGISTSALEVVLACANGHVSGTEAFINECNLELVCSNLVSAPDVEDNVQLKIFPNPFSDELNIDYLSNNVAELIIYDSTLRPLFHKEFLNKISFNTHMLENGFYIYEVKSDRTSKRVGVLIKNSLK